MDTPLQDHIPKADFEFVYEPAEDSFLMIDALEKEMPFLKERRASTCMEVGSGSGISITAYGMAFRDCFCLATDINLKACHMTRSTALRNGVILDSVQTDLVSGFLDGRIDVLIFNPPYVVTESSECVGRGIEASWAGGVRGREVIDRFLPAVPRLLSRDGVCYLLAIEENDPKDIAHIMKTFQFRTEKVIGRRVRNENQSVLKFVRDL